MINARFRRRCSICVHRVNCKLLPEVYVISKEEVEEQIVNAEKFCEAVQEYLKESGPQ